MRSPEMARLMTSCWISLVPSKIVWIVRTASIGLGQRADLCRHTLAQLVELDAATTAYVSAISLGAVLGIIPKPTRPSKPPLGQLTLF